MFLLRRKGSISSVLERWAYHPNLFNEEWSYFSATSRCACAGPSMAVKMMECSYHILLSYNLLTYSTAKTPDGRKV